MFRVILLAILLVMPGLSEARGIPASDRAFAKMVRNAMPFKDWLSRYKNICPYQPKLDTLFTTKDLVCREGNGLPLQDWVEEQTAFCPYQPALDSLLLAVHVDCSRLTKAMSSNRDGGS